MINKQKLLFIYGPLGGGGAERVLIDLLSHLDYNRYEVDLCLMVNGGILLPEVPAQVTVTPLWESYNWYYKIAYRVSIWFRSNYLFKRVLKKKLTKKYDTEISFLEGMPLKLHALMDTPAKKITWVHCDLFNFHYTHNQFVPGEELGAYNKMDVVVAVSNDAMDAFSKRFRSCTAEKEVIYNPIDTDKILRMAKEETLAKKECLTIVTVGRLTLPKRMDRIIRLAQRFKKEGVDACFQIIGDGELKDELLLLRKELDVEDRVELLGFQKNPFPYIQNADVMLLCSGYEGFGLVVCEAMCLGVPVVSTKTAGPTEIIDHNRYGLLCDHDDESIYQAVKEMLDQPELRKTYHNAGLKRAKFFTVENVIKKIDNLIDYGKDIH